MSEKTYVTPTGVEGLRIRSGPSTEGTVVATVYFPEMLEVNENPASVLAKIGNEGQWINVTSEQGSGYVAAWFVQQSFVSESGAAPEVPTDAASQPTAPVAPTPVQPVVAPPKLPTVPPVQPVITPPSPTGPPLTLSTSSPEGLRVRSGPGRQYDTAGSITPQDRVQAVDPNDARAKLGRDGEWIQITMPNGQTGWAAAWFLREPPKVLELPIGHALAGVHGPTDPGMWPWDDINYSILQKARVEAVKVLAAEDMGAPIVDRLRTVGVKFIMARLFAKFPVRRTVDDFLHEIDASTGRLYAAGVRYFEVHNEPNLHHADGPEGMWVMWQNGKEFGDFFLQCRDILKQRYPEGLWGWPGLSPGLDVSKPDGTPLRYDSERFMREAEPAMRQADFICLHTYWGADGSPYTRSLQDLRRYAEMFPDKVIIASEFSNSSPKVEKQIKGQEYQKLFNEARTLPANVGALISYVLSASAGYPYEIWRDSPIPDLVGKR